MRLIKPHMDCNATNIAYVGVRCIGLRHQTACFRVRQLVTGPRRPVVRGYHEIASRVRLGQPKAQSERSPCARARANPATVSPSQIYLGALLCARLCAHLA
eukprot:3545244-Prymnesium_polylepis.2